MEEVWHSQIGRFLDPAGLAFDQAVGKYFTRVSAVVAFASSAQAQLFMALLAPSPLANSFTAAGPENKKINQLLMEKLPPIPAATIRERYPSLFEAGFTKMRDGKSPSGTSLSPPPAPECFQIHLAG